MVSALVGDCDGVGGVTSGPVAVADSVKLSSTKHCATELRCCELPLGLGESNCHTAHLLDQSFPAAEYCGHTVDAQAVAWLLPLVY